MFSISAKILLDFDRSCLGLQMALGSMGILTVLILPIHKNEIAVHVLCVSPSGSFTVLLFSVYMSFTSLVRLISKYFVVFVATVNEIVYFFRYFFVVRR